MKQLSHLTQSFLGCAVGTTIVGAWAASMAFALTRMPATLWPPGASQLIMFVWLQFLYVGLFITAHDACHGSLAPGRPWINKFFGYLCAGLYAGFDFGHLNKQHHLHHLHPGTQDDPDFHSTQANAQSFSSWAYRFFTHYLTWKQILVMTAVSQVLLKGLGVPPTRLYFYWVAPSVLSALQLFYFGTYLPHRTNVKMPFEDAFRARNSSYGFIVSLLTCYHFGYHHVHHAKPHLAWYHLPKGRAAAIGRKL